MENTIDINELVNEIKNRGYDVQTQKVVQNNVTKTGIIITDENNPNVNPTLYVEDFIVMNDIKTIADRIISAIKSHPFDTDISDVSEWNKIKDKIKLQVIGKANNEDYLTDKVYKDYNDMAIIFRVILDRVNGGIASFVITKTMADSYNKTADELYDTAIKNPAMNEYEIVNMYEMLHRMMGPTAPTCPDDSMPIQYVITSMDSFCGAGLIAYDKALIDIYNTIGGDYYILPSSIHELIATPVNTGMRIDDLRSMVTQINATTVKPEERLTDNVYIYTMENGKGSLRVA